MKPISRYAWWAYSLAPIIVVLDQLSKSWVLSLPGLSFGASQVLWGPISATLVRNPGVSFGLLQSHGDLSRWLLSAFEVVVAIGLVVWVSRTRHWLLGLACGLIIGGALGNVIDRVRLGAVTDFIDVRHLIAVFPWIFNLADSAISVGVVLLLAESFWPGERKSG